MAVIRRRLATILAGTALATLMALGTQARADTAPPGMAQAYAPTAENLAARQWFQDARFGIFLHWGLYSELGGAGKMGIAEWIMDENQIPARHYERLARFFNPTAFDADAWAQTFKAAGARYVVITSKHHEGFAMFASKASPYNVVDATPFHRDPLAELAAACRKAGLKLFFYYSQLDWHHPDYFPQGTTGHASERPAGGDWDRYIDFEQAQLRELLTHYGPIGGIWFDGWWDQKDTAMRDRWRLDETYRLIHSLQPAALIGNNHHQTPFPGEDFQMFERDLPGENSMGFNKAGVSALPLEMAETMNGSWGFNMIDDQYKSTATLIRSLVGAAGRNANFLMNTGPMPNGELQPENVQTLKEMGQWLRRYGESVYQTRGGPVTPRPWGVTTQAPGRVYVHVLDWKDGPLFLPLTQAVRKATLLRDGSAVPVQPRPDGLELTLPAATGEAMDGWDRVIRLDLSP
ncbi:alpha-L-fucosidase [Nitrospirillum amazonense]|uniref:alpha-L-fucosidase n=1 Tax=Nitrospirillum amazonense TaxID=28077 RepID=UPI002412C9D6|nr:alpha-L-fucosidase [Nitrospirillum amazonense]MDG3442803.1 alpha-L-fucosidase [Nitrospirillum amazonense]